MTQEHLARLVSGTTVAQEILGHTAGRVERFTAQVGAKPCLATVLVGDDPASVTYVRMKQNRAKKLGIDTRHLSLPGSTSTERLMNVITRLSADSTVHGILLQHPVPEHINERAAFEAIAPEKDVDGVTTHSFASMAFGSPGFESCTPGGIIKLLDAAGVDIAGKHAVVLGRSPILGKPAALLLLGRDATVTVCHSRTRDLPSIVRTADIVVAAVGKPEFVRGSWLKPGSVVIDAGYNEGNIGDVAFAEARTHAAAITPVPGGVGPMTIAVLLSQTVDAACRQHGIDSQETCSATSSAP